MYSKIIWKLNQNNTIVKVTKNSNKLYANSKASVQYCLISDFISQDNVVVIVAERNGEKFAQKMHFDNKIILEDGTIKSGWSVVSNGAELNFDAQFDSVINFNFNVKKFSKIDYNDVYSQFNSSKDAVPVYPSDQYYPEVNPSDVDLILRDITRIENIINSGELEASGIKPFDYNFSYSQGTFVLSGDSIYASKVMNNFNHEITDTEYWVLVGDLGQIEVNKSSISKLNILLRDLSNKVAYSKLESAGVTPYQMDYEYELGSYIFEGTKIYKSLAGSNLGNNPSTSDKWELQGDLADIESSKIDITNIERDIKRLQNTTLQNSSDISDLKQKSIKNENDITDTNTTINKFYDKNTDTLKAKNINKNNQPVATENYVDTQIANIKRVVAISFDTLQQFKDWINGTYTRPDGRVVDDMVIGDQALIKEKKVPDYWYSSDTKPITFEDNFTELEGDVDLTNYLQKSTEQEIVYGTDRFARQITLHYNETPYGDGIAKRTGDGRLKGTTPTEINDLTTKDYVDNNKTTVIDYNGNTLKNAKFSGTDTINVDLKDGDAETFEFRLNDKFINGIVIPEGTDVLTFDWDSYESNTWFKGNNLLGTPEEIKEHNEVIIHLLKYRDTRFVIELYHVGIYESSVNKFINFHYADKFRGWERFLTSLDLSQLNNFVAIDMSADVELLKENDSFIVMKDMTLPTVPTTRAKKGDIYQVLIASPELELLYQGNIGGKSVETITPTTWVAEDNAPYTQSTTITLSTRLTDDSIVELVNDNALAFAKYGFAILTIVGQDVKIVSVEEVTEQIPLTFFIGG